MATYGRIKEFIPDTHSMRIYLDEVEAYFKANRIEDKQKVMVLLSSIGSPTFMKLSDLMSRHSPLTKTYKQLTDALLKHCEPRRIEIAEHYANGDRRRARRSPSTLPSSTDWQVRRLPPSSVEGCICFRRKR